MNILPLIGASLIELWNSFSSEYKLYVIVIALFIPVTILGVVASVKVNSTFNKYSAMISSCGLTAAEIARKVLDENGLYSVGIVRIAGNLTDHFDPRTQVVSLSESVYSSRSVAAIGVACHEVGHAVQHAKKFVFSSLRIKLVPVVNFASRMLFPLIFVGMLLGFASPYTLFGTVLIWAGVAMFGLSMLFSLVTLPTEFDASRRAQAALKSGYLSSVEAAASRKVLTAAAMTYVVSFLMSLLQFLRFFALLLMTRKRN